MSSGQSDNRDGVVYRYCLSFEVSKRNVRRSSVSYVGSTRCLRPLEQNTLVHGFHDTLVRAAHSDCFRDVNFHPAGITFVYEQPHSLVDVLID